MNCRAAGEAIEDGKWVGEADGTGEEEDEDVESVKRPLSALAGFIAALGVEPTMRGNLEEGMPSMDLSRELFRSMRQWLISWCWSLRFTSRSLLSSSVTGFFFFAG